MKTPQRHLSLQREGFSASYHPLLVVKLHDFHTYFSYRFPQMK
jgi:hypothetical protein